MPKTKPKLTCSPHWVIRHEPFPGRGGVEYHRVGRCLFWNPRVGNLAGKRGRCMKRPDIPCPFRGVRDFTKLEPQGNRYGRRDYDQPAEEEEVIW